MVNSDTFHALALSFPETEKVPHFENTAFKVGKKIFVTWSEKENRVCLKLSPVEQTAFCAWDETVIYPVPNKWGRKGWTFIMLDQVPRETLQDALKTAWRGVAPKRLVKNLDAAAEIQGPIKRS